jgi:hypothetical protein
MTEIQLKTLKTRHQVPPEEVIKIQEKMIHIKWYNGKNILFAWIFYFEGNLYQRKKSTLYQLDVIMKHDLPRYNASFHGKNIHLNKQYIIQYLKELTNDTEPNWESHNNFQYPIIK